MRLLSRSLAPNSLSTLIRTRSAVCPWLESGHCIAMVQMRMLARVEVDRAATVHLQAQPPVVLDALDGPQLAIRNFQFVSRRGELDAVAY